MIKREKYDGMAKYHTTQMGNVYKKEYQPRRVPTIILTK